MLARPSVGQPGKLTATHCFDRYIAAPYKPRIKHNRVYASCYFNTMEDPGADAVNECLAVMAVSRSRSYLTQCTY